MTEEQFLGLLYKSGISFYGANDEGQMICFVEETDKNKICLRNAGFVKENNQYRLNKGGKDFFLNTI